MEKLNDTILVYENCVANVYRELSMHECIRICQTQELICKCLKVGFKNKSSQATLKNLKCYVSYILEMYKYVVHIKKDIVLIVKENEKIVEYLKK